MGTVRTASDCLAVILFGFASAAHAQGPSPDTVHDLGGTSWQLVRFQGSDGASLTPGDGSKYTISFDGAGGVSARIDCNRGHGTWTSAGANQLQFGPLALTRAMCPPGPLTDRLPRDWDNVRSYTLKDGHLFLSLVADGGTYEFAPLGSQDSASAQRKSNGTNASALPPLPATFVGTMPCADCPGIRYQVILKPDHTFSSHMEYEERNTSVDDSGRWELVGNGKMLVLHGSRGATDKFAVRNSDTLHKLDMDGNEIPSPYNYDLKRISRSQSAEGSAPAVTALQRTHWSLMRLGDAVVSRDSLQTEAYLVLDPENHRVSGSSGCNRLAGSYELNGDHLKFGQMAGTMMACPKGMDTEQSFLQALDQVSTWKITDQHLELLDTGGKLLAQFETQPSNP